jgi:alkylation response protein AidB-like acyl-CoA dehydrogenase
MDFSLSAEDLEFRDELRAFLDAHIAEFRDVEDDAASGGPGPDGASPEARLEAARRVMERRRAWQRLLNDHRLAAITWPVEWGGRAATVSQHAIYAEEMARYRAPGLFNPNGIWQIGPMIIAHGTDEQRRRWLPSILSADEHWCQGFSEPEAGSDLANLRTLAIDDGDRYLVTGRKIWTSTAHFADWGLFLVRTDPTAIERGAKHEGITALVVDMHAPGITVTPIRDLTGDKLFCEVVFEEAPVPKTYRLGAKGAGWQVAMGTLGHERVGTAGLSVGLRVELDALVALAREHNPEALEDPEIRDRLARLFTQLEFTRLLNARALSKVQKGEPTWPEVPLAKLQWSYLSQALAELALDLLDLESLLAKGAPGAIARGRYARNFVWQRFTSIGAGTTEVQKNIIADRAIKMPRR